MKCFRRFFVRCRRSHGSTSLHALRPVSLYFLGSTRFSKILIFQDEALQKVLVQILLSVCICRARWLSRFKRPGPRPKFPERWLLFRLVV